MARQLSKNGQNEQKSSLFCLSHFLPRDPNWADFYEPVPPLKLAPLALLCSQGMLETTWGVFQVAQAKSFDLRGVEAMSVKRFQRYGCFRENFFFEPNVKIWLRLWLAFVFVFVCAYLYLYLCICVFVFVYLYLYLIMTTFCFGSFLMKIHSWDKGWLCMNT